MKWKILSVQVILLVVLLLCTGFVDDQDATTQVEPVYKDMVASDLYIPHEPIEIVSNDNFIETAANEGWPGNGTAGNPFIISGYRISGLLYGQPLVIWDSDLHWRFINNLIEGGPGAFCGTAIGNSSNGEISECIFQDRHNGMSFISVSNIKVFNNIVRDCWGKGIDFAGGLDDVEIWNNTIENCAGDGIHLGSLMFSCFIFQNRIDNCGMNGISIVGSQKSEISRNNITNCNQNGISIDHGFTDLIVENVIEDITGMGIDIQFSASSEVKDNEISRCGDYAVSLDSDCNHVRVLDNVFIDNGQSCQIFDSGTDNIFEQNYFDDWVSPDHDFDNIVDVPYQIEGEAFNEDPYPVADLDYITRSLTETIDEGSTNTSESLETIDEAGMDDISLLMVGVTIGVVVVSVLALKIRKKY
ncbi:MAG: right-handed parallel beta-helix repeat-containing protein [Candidatus Thorarchaeota archaeon]